MDWFSQVSDFVLYFKEKRFQTNTNAYKLYYVHVICTARTFRQTNQ